MLKKGQVISKFLVIIGFSNFLNFGIISLSAQAFTRYDCDGNGVPENVTFCTLSQLFGGGNISVSDKDFTTWTKEKDMKTVEGEVISGGVNETNIRVSGILPQPDTPGLKFNSINSELSVQGNVFTGFSSIDFDFDYKVTITNPLQKIIDNELKFSGTVANGSLVGNNPRIEIKELVGTAKGMDDLAQKEVFERVSDNPAGGKTRTRKKTDQATFKAQDMVWVRKQIRMFAPTENDLASIQNFEQLFSQTNPPSRMQQKQNRPRVNGGSRRTIIFDAVNENLSFDDIVINSAFLNDGIPTSIDDRILGASVLIGDTEILAQDSNVGWFLGNTIYQILVEDVPVLTADLVDAFLFKDTNSMSEFDSEFQGVLENIVINNTIDSPYLELIQQQIDSPRLISIVSNILSETDNLEESGSSEICDSCFIDGEKVLPVSEPSSILGFLVLGTMGTVLVFKHRV